MVHTMLWIDEDVDDWWAPLNRIARGFKLELRAATSIAEARRYLAAPKDEQPQIIILDIIMRTGSVEGLGPLASDAMNVPNDTQARYTGLSLLEAYPGIVDRTIIFTVVPQKEVRGAERFEQMPWLLKTRVAAAGLREAIRNRLGAIGNE